MLQAALRVKWSLILTVASVIAATIFLGPAAGFIMVVLIAIEIAFSFDNAVVNAKILEHLSPLWQKLFLTIGILIAVFGMRLVFPILIVALTASLDWGTVINLALTNPDEYSRYLEKAQSPLCELKTYYLFV